MLGPVELRADGRVIDLGPAKPRLLLAVLLMEAGRTVPFDTLVDRVWNESVPAKVANSVQSNVSRLRRHLEECHDDRIELLHTPARGYRLLVPPECVDVLEFTRIAKLGRAAAEQGQTRHAVDLLAAAGRLVTGTPLSGLQGPWSESTRAGLIERIHAVAVQRISLQLETEDPRTLIAELRELAGSHPFDEEVAGLLMRCLHASGRTADALDEYKAIAHRLKHELGLTPQAPLNDTHLLVLGSRRKPSAADDSAARPPAPTLSSPGPAESPEAPNTLEREPPGFVGRKDDLDTLTHEINLQLQAGLTAVCVIAGMAGAGKSTLALKLAYLLQERCPDGKLHLNLRGHDAHQSPTSAETALGLLLGMLRTNAEEVQLAAGLDHALALWRRRTSNRRLLILLDDAFSAEQILPLIPAGSGSIILVTARKRLADLPDAIHHALPFMKTDDASALFARAARRAATDDPADESAVKAVVAACGRLPLALSIAGGSLSMRPSWTIADLAEYLTQSMASAQADTLTTRMTAAFDLSYRDLPDLPRRILRRLALYPSTRITVHTAAALADASVSDADLALNILVDNHLVHEPQRHAYRIHDLIRHFATRVLNREETAQDRHEAELRLLQFVVATVERATRQFHPYRHVNLAAHVVIPSSLSPLNFADTAQAAAWLDSEQASLRTLIEYWFGHDHPWEAAALTHMLAMYMDRRSLWKQSIRLHEFALDTWSRHGHAVGQATALTDLSTARWRLNPQDLAHTLSESALDLWVALGDTSGQADALLQLGRKNLSIHRHADAIDCFQRCAALREANHEDHGLAVALYHLGAVLITEDRLREAIAPTRRALELAQAIGDDAVERNAANNLGAAYFKLTRYSEAEVFFSRAYDLARQLGDSRNIAVAAMNLGDLYSLLEQPDSALAFLDEAAETFRRLGDDEGRSSTLLLVARHRIQLGEIRAAREAINEAASIADRLGDSLQLASARLASGDVYCAEQDHDAALRSYRDALDYAAEAQSRLLQATAHRGIGDMLKLTGEQAAAQVHWRRALDLLDSDHSQEADSLRSRLDQSGPRAS